MALLGLLGKGSKEKGRRKTSKGGCAGGREIVGKNHSREQEPAVHGGRQWDCSESREQTVLVHSVTFLVTANSAQAPLVPRVGFVFFICCRVWLDVPCSVLWPDQTRGDW